MMKNFNFNLVANFVLLILVVALFVAYSHTPKFRTGYSIWEDGAQFTALGTFIMSDKNYENDANRVQLATIECDLIKKICIESVVMNNHNISLNSYITQYNVELTPDGFLAKKWGSSSELIYNRKLKTLIKNYQIDGQIFPLKLESKNW